MAFVLIISLIIIRPYSRLSSIDHVNLPAERVYTTQGSNFIIGMSINNFCLANELFGGGGPELHAAKNLAIFVW